MEILLTIIGAIVFMLLLFAARDDTKEKTKQGILAFLESGGDVMYSNGNYVFDLPRLNRKWKILRGR